MKSIRILLAIVSVGIVAVFLITCGGDGGGEGSSTGSGGGGSVAATLTAANTPQATAAAMQAANLVGASSAMGAIQPPSTSSSLSLENYSNPPLRNILDKVISISMGQEQKTGLNVTGVHIEGSMTQFTESCSGGGFIIVNNATWTGPDHPTDSSQVVDFQANMTFNSCNQSTETMNGALAVKFTGPLTSSSKIAIAATNFFFSNSASSDSITMNLTMTYTNFTFSGNQIIAATIAMTGTVTGSVSGNPVNAEYYSFTMSFSSNASGTTVSISGKINPVCLAGWFTITTNTPLFIPTNATCPTAGNIVATAGAGSVNVVVTSDSRIIVYFNRAVFQAYNNCPQVYGFCAEPPGPSYTFRVGQRIMASSSGASVRDSQLALLWPIAQVPGVHGTIVGGPMTGTAGNPPYTGNWWQIKWDSEPPNQFKNVYGWSAESVILAVSSSYDQPQPPPTLTNSNYATTKNIFFPQCAPNSVGGNLDTTTTCAGGGSLMTEGNCTWYAYGRMLEKGHSPSSLSVFNGDASQWATNALNKGYKVSGTPAVGTIAQLTTSGTSMTGTYAGYPHVAVVESVNTADGTITVSESSFIDLKINPDYLDDPWNILWRHRTCKAKWFSNFIYVP